MIYLYGKTVQEQNLYPGGKLVWFEEVDEDGDIDNVGYQLKPGISIKQFTDEFLDRFHSESSANFIKGFLDMIKTIRIGGLPQDVLDKFENNYSLAGSGSHDLTIGFEFKGKSILAKMRRFMKEYTEGVRAMENQGNRYDKYKLKEDRLNLIGSLQNICETKKKLKTKG